MIMSGKIAAARSPSGHTERHYGPIGRAKILDVAMVDALTEALRLIHGTDTAKARCRSLQLCGRDAGTNP
jgi:hypothetical protein